MLRRRRWAIAGGALVVAGGLTAALWHSSSPASYDPPPRTRQYIAFTSCLLTGPAGMADAATRVAWSGLQAASAPARAQTQFLAAVGPVETVGSVTPFANTLVQQHCDLVVAVGAVEVQAVQAVASQNSHVHFILVGSGSGSGTGNVAVVGPGPDSEVSSKLASLVGSAIRGFAP